MSETKMKGAKLPLAERIEAAIGRIASGHGAMRIPPEATDPDIVLADCQEALAALVAAIGKARLLIGAQSDCLSEAARAANVNSAWHVLDAALKAAGVGT